MKRTSHSSRTGIKSGQGDRTPRGSRSVFISFLVLGASFLVLAALTIGFYRLYIATGGYSLGLLACLWWLAIAVLMGLLVLFSLRVRTKNALPGPTVGLISALQGDPDPSVRAKAAERLAELDVEEFAHHHKHNKLDNILMSALQGDPDPGVRAKAAEGLAQLELEESSYHPEHNNSWFARFLTIY